MAGKKEIPQAKDKAGSQQKGKRPGSLFLQLFLIGLVFALLAPWTVWFFLMRDPGPTLDERLMMAKEAISKGDNAEAKRQILLLQEAKYVGENHGGTLEYLNGILSFREAELMDGLSATAMYRRSVSYLRAAEKKSLPADFLPKKAYALGVSLCKLGLIREAEPVLRVAWETCLEEQGRVGMLISQCELNPNIDLSVDESQAGIDKTALKYQLSLNKSELVLQKKNLSEQQRMLALQQRVDLLLRLGQIEKAWEALGDAEMNYQKLTASDPLLSLDQMELILLRGKILFLEKKYQQVLDLFKPYLQHKNSYENDVLRQAHLIMGESYEKLGDVDQAIANYKACTKLEEKDEMIPASLKIANLLRGEKDQHEQSYELYLGVLRQTLDESTFNNRLISWGEIRTQLRDAWKDWVSIKQFRWAMDLSERLPPLFSLDEANEMSAIVSKMWAESIQVQYDKSEYDQRETLYPQVVDRWRQAGLAFSFLAKSRISMASYPDALWNATLMFRKGNDYEKALENLDLFLVTQPRELLPTALVLRGEILMDLHGKPPHQTLEQAIEVFQQVIDEHPRDTASFRAQINLGKAYLEKDNPEKALAVWKKILTQTELTPDAYEWRHAQYLLAKTWVNHIEQLFYKIRQVANTDPQKTKEYENQAYAQLDISINTLKEFNLREKDPALLLEAKDLLATALHKYAQRAANQLPSAETEDLKKELKSEIQKSLNEVIDLYKNIKISLQPASAANLLNMHEQMMLKNAYFMTGHLHYELAQYDESNDYFTVAIENYRDAVNYYPQDPRVLLAYYQMSNCFERIGQARQAKSYLEQARIILMQIPNDQFTKKQTNFTKEEWQKLLDQSLQLHETQTMAN